jgi:FAD/FMN-containing dehydrogenase
MRQVGEFRGELFAPTDEGYDEARTVFNELRQGRPAVVARCAGIADVRLALEMAREQNLDVSVRGGGHSVAGWSTNDDGLVVDLSRMGWVHVDAETSTAWIGGGTVATDLVTEASQYGLAAVTGTNPGPGVTGLVMGVGEGYLTPRHGFGGDNVLAFEVVTADGSLLNVSADEHPDLFWAMRGAGANFGVVTAVKLRLYPMPEQCTGGMIEFSPDDEVEVTRCVWKIMEKGSEFFFPFYGFGPSDDPERPRIMFSVGHTGTPELAERELAELRACARPIADEARTMSYWELVHQEHLQDHCRTAWDVYRLAFDGPSAQQMQLLLDQRKTVIPNTSILLWRTVPKPLAPPSVCPRLPGISLFPSGWWEHEQDDKAILAWLEATSACFSRSEVVTDAANTVNHVVTLDDDRAKRLYGAENYARLRRLKAKYDPDNVFRSNNNIRPDDERA